jgi:Ca2+-binding EF-hand superfamily protein
MVRGPMNKNRERLVRKAFAVIDKDGDGDLDISDVKKCYNAKMHPDVRSGKKDEDEILYEFLDTFEQHYALNNPGAKGNKDRSVSPDEFVAYYENVSCSIDNDDYFIAMMTSAWNLDNKKP